MRKLICKVFGCSWKYYFTSADSYRERVDVRICKRCGKVQHFKRIFMFPDGEDVWMNMIQYTKLGAREYWESKERGE